MYRKIFLYLPYLFLSTFLFLWFLLSQLQRNKCKNNFYNRIFKNYINFFFFVYNFIIFFFFLVLVKKIEYISVILLKYYRIFVQLTKLNHIHGTVETQNFYVSLICLFNFNNIKPNQNSFFLMIICIYIIWEQLSEKAV